LTFLTTGAWQHVFVETETGREGERWVYKLPAAFGYVLPFNHPRCCFRANEIYARTLRFLLIRLPERFHEKCYQRLMGHAGMPRRFGRLLKLVERLIQWPPVLGEKILSRYLKRTTLNQFETMVDIMEYLSRQGLADTLLPYQIIRDGAAVLRVGGKEMAYRGPILKQKKADLLFEESENLESFDWQDIVRAQHRLWRHGVTLRRAHGIFGPRGWALLDGRMQLFDTSGLTKDIRVARRSLTENELDQREGSPLAQARPADSFGSAAEYFRFMRREINQDRLVQLWGADLPGKH
jgi:hypothetical protein